MKEKETVYLGFDWLDSGDIGCFLFTPDKEDLDEYQYFIEFNRLDKGPKKFKINLGVKHG